MKNVKNKQCTHYMKVEVGNVNANEVYIILHEHDRVNNLKIQTKWTKHSLYEKAVLYAVTLYEWLFTRKNELYENIRMEVVTELKNCCKK